MATKKTSVAMVNELVDKARAQATKEMEARIIKELMEEETMATKKITTTNTTDKYTYAKIDVYVEKNPPTDCPIQLAHLAARAATSGDTKAFDLYTQASLDALQSVLKAKKITCAVNASDVMGMATCKAWVSKDLWEAPVDVYIKRLFDVGRASKPKPKTRAKAEAKADPVDTLIEQAGGVEALLKALLEKVK
jgi:hypothetical protein